MPAPKTAQKQQPKPETKTAPKREPRGKSPGWPEPKEPVDHGPGYVSGNLTADPELRYTPTGRAVCNLRVAETPRIKNDAGEWVDGETSFYTLNVWGQMGENCSEAFQKGDRIIAHGNWRERFWITNEDEERSVTEMTVADIGPSILFRTAKLDRTQRSKSY
jgi:single-strand DNA-binding protein